MKIVVVTALVVLAIYVISVFLIGFFMLVDTIVSTKKHRPLKFTHGDILFYLVTAPWWLGKVTWTLLAIAKEELDNAMYHTYPKHNRPSA